MRAGLASMFLHFCQGSLLLFTAALQDPDLTLGKMKMKTVSEIIAQMSTEFFVVLKGLCLVQLGEIWS